MNYDEFPIFQSITNEAATYLDSFDDVLKKNNVVLEPEELFIRKVDLYYDYLDTKNKAKNEIEFNNTITHNLARSANSNYSPSLMFLTDKIYDVRRFAKNERPNNTMSYNRVLENWKEKDTSLEVLEGGIDENGNLHGSTGWIYKTSPQHYKDKKAKKEIHRFILNVDPNSELLDKLDYFALKYSCQYKCADREKMAYERPDTIVIYTADGRIAEQSTELQNLVKPYVRKNGNEQLDGDKIADGIHIAKEASRDDVQKVINKCQQSYPRLANYYMQKLQSSNSSHPLSLGQFKILQDLNESYENLKGIKSPEKQTAIASQITTEELLKNKGVRLQTELLSATVLGDASGRSKKINITYKKNGDRHIFQGDNFILRLDAKEKTYTLEQYNPPKKYSNKPELNCPKLPDYDLQQFKAISRIGMLKAPMEVALHNGVEVPGKNGFICTVKKNDLPNHPNSTLFENRDADGNLTAKVMIDENGMYIAKNYVTGLKYSNDPEMIKRDSSLKLLPKAILDMYQSRAVEAVNIAYAQVKQVTISKNNHCLGS